jgi:2-polyprenyl-6-hydroxyphenyl methylase/3-demethylubiquinone-9 3-methyltransferase
MSELKQFDFGQNWAEFSAAAATPERVAQARKEFAELMRGVALEGASFLDIGFGQGFSLLSAAALGARAVGCDINPKCHEVIERNRPLFPDVGAKPIPLQVGSILDDAVVAALRARADAGGFDVVHSWGVLHHTGDMKLAIANAASLVRPGGTFVIAIYNRHWSSLPWLAIKAAYVHSPAWLQKAMIGALYPVIWLAKLAVTGKNPKSMDRGMEFYYNVVDWVGGYPYEYGTVDEIAALCRPLGLGLQRSVAAQVPTGCNELVFRKDGDAGR